jgi:hypothetical protein
MTTAAGLTLALVAAGAALLWPALQRWGRGVATAAMVVLLFATPAYGVALGGGWLMAGAFLAGAALVRAALAAPEVERPRLRAIGRAAAGLALACGLLLLVRSGEGPWRVMDGLFGSRDGLLFWAPALWLGIAGLAARTLPSRALPLALLLAVAVAADPGEVRAARVAPVLPLLALGIARALAAIRDASARRPLLPVAAGVAVLALWNALLMAQYRDGRIPRDDTVAFARVARNAAASVSAAAGAPNAWPASWIYAARHRVAPARYDLLAGMDAFAGAGALGGIVDVGEPGSDAALLEEGWSVRHPCGAHVCRAVEGTATLRVPLRQAEDLDLAVVAAGSGTLTVAIGGVPVLQAPLDEALVARRARVPRARFRGGLETITLAVTPGGRALVDRVVLRRGGGPA